MVPDEVNRKLSIAVLVIAAIGGAIFLFFQFIINKAYLVIETKNAPISISLSNGLRYNCQTSPCEHEIVPGTYTLSVTKNGYKSESRDITIPIYQKVTKIIDLDYIPTLETSDNANIPSKPKGIKYAELSGITYFKDKSNKYLVYLKLDENTGNQALYYRSIASDGSLAAEVYLTSFIRKYQNYTILSDIDNSKKIIIVDRNNEKQSLYIYDISKKERSMLLSLALVEDLKWLSENSILIYGRDFSDTTEGLYSYSFNEAKLTNLKLLVPLKNVIIKDNNTLIVATNQSLAYGTDNPIILEPIILENTTSQNGFSIVKYSINNQSSVLLYFDKDLNLPPEIFDNDKNIISFQEASKKYQLKISE